MELAARIGQSLLQRNHLLQERNEALEEQLAQALDQVAHACLFIIIEDDAFKFFLPISLKNYRQTSSGLSL